MQKITIGYGLLMILIGVGGYFGSGMVSVTALIPAFLGTPILILGWIAIQDKWRKHAMHGVVLLALISLGGTIPGLIKLPTLLSGGEIARPPAVIAQSVVAVLSLVFIVLAVKSFIDARKSSTESEAEPT